MEMRGNIDAVFLKQERSNKRKRKNKFHLPGMETVSETAK